MKTLLLAGLLAVSLTANAGEYGGNHANANAGAKLECRFITICAL